MKSKQNLFDNRDYAEKRPFYDKTNKMVIIG